MDGSSSPAAEPEALTRLFSYLVKSIDTTAILPAALSRGLITDRQRAECSNETDSAYQRAEKFLSYLQRAVNADYDNYHLFVSILKETRNQAQIASRLRDELVHSTRSVQQPSASRSTGEECVVVPETLVKELADLRFAFAKLVRNYEKQLRNSPEAQQEFVEFLPRLFPHGRAVDDHSFQTHFNTLVENEVSLFNTHYLKRLCSIFSEDVCATTRQLVDEYTQQRKRFMTSATVGQFKQLFPTTATSSKMLSGKVSFTIKIKNYWDKNTLDDLTKLITLFGVSGSHLHLSKVEDGCIAVTWLCSTSEVEQLKGAILEATGSLQTMGVLQVFIGEEELVLECSVTAAAVKQLDDLPQTSSTLSMSSPPSPASTAAAVKQLKEPSDLPQTSSTVLEQSPLIMSSSPTPASTVSLTHKPVAVHLVHKTDVDYQCPICYELFTEPLSEPFITDCGHLCCRKCRDSLLDSSKTDCPICREPEMLSSARFDKYVQRVVRSLEVRCSDYDVGCEWVGELRDLHDHIDPAKGRCGIACPFGCGKYDRRSEMKEHTSHHCHKRMISCKNCGYYNTFTIVTEKHNPICPRSPIDCPNQHCPVEGLKRHQLEQHLNECCHQLVDCPNTGCSVRLPHGELKLHALMKHNLVLEETNQAVAITPATVSPQYLYNQAPIEFIISDYDKKKESKEEWQSQFYTHNRGYKFCLVVYPNGHRKGKDTHLSVYAQLMRGEYDSELKLPFEGDIRVELLNWREDNNHRSHTIDFNRYTDPYGLHSSVTNQETVSGLGTQLISHTNLASTTNTEYLRENYLKLRVSVAVYSKPLLALTPSWQDPLISTQSGTQFTISEYSKRKQFNNRYYSLPFTTSPQGYQLCLAVYANGYGIGKDSHLSIFAYIMKGQHDDHLQWPFTGTIIIELLNWLEDKEHRTKKLPIDEKCQLVKVTKGEYGNCFGYPRFIFQSSLASNTKYLYNDCIRVGVLAKASD